MSILQIPYLTFAFCGCIGAFCPCIDGFSDADCARQEGLYRASFWTGKTCLRRSRTVSSFPKSSDRKLSTQKTPCHGLFEGTQNPCRHHIAIYCERSKFIETWKKRTFWTQRACNKTERLIHCHLDSETLVLFFGWSSETSGTCSLEQEASPATLYSPTQNCTASASSRVPVLVFFAGSYTNCQANVPSDWLLA